MTAGDWRAALEADEWCFARIDSSVALLSTTEAFAEISSCAALLPSLADEFLLQQCGYLLLALARQADTTERPEQLKKSWSAIMRSLEGAPQLSSDLRRWYRMPKPIEPRIQPARHPKNVPGGCYVEFDCCTLCGVPEAVAPSLFSSDDSGCCVSKQPSTPDETAKMIEIIDSQELGCVRYQGTNPILAAADKHEQDRIH